MGLSDRIAVMFDGRIMGERLPSETDEAELGLLMAGIDKPPADRPLHEVVEERLAQVSGEVR